MFVGVIFFHFNNARYGLKKSGLLLNDDQRRWLDMQKQIIKAKPSFYTEKAPKNYIQLKFYEIINNKYFEIFIICCIIINIIQMGLIYEGASKNYLEALEVFNLIFTIIFIIEAILKILALGLRTYFHSSWNKFDFFVVLTSLVDIILNFIGKEFLYILRIGPQLARIFRVLRVSRLVKLIKRFQGIHKIIGSLIFALPSLINVGALLFLLFFIYAVLGVFIFSEVKV